MAIELLMPALSPTMKEGTLAKWNKKEGDKVKIGEMIAEIETDKAIMEIEAIDEGIIGKILVAEGASNVPVNKVIAILLEEAEDPSIIDELLSKKQDIANIAQANNDNKDKSDKKEVLGNVNISRTEKKIFSSPLARRIAAQNNIDLRKIEGSGPRGRIVKDDVLSALSRGEERPKSESNLVTQIVGRNGEETTKLPNSNMRKVIAKRLSESKRDIPHFYLDIEIQMDKLLAVRKELNTIEDIESKSSKVSVNDLIIKATATTLKMVPEANSAWTEEATLLYNNIDIAMAVAIDGGLITPIIQNADHKSIMVISNQMKDLASKAKANKLRPEEFQGGSFTISNLGMFGIDSFKAIINPPQSCILSIGKTSEKVMVVKGQMVIASMMNVTLSCDHRVIDGSVAARFLAKFKENIENPIRMLAN